MTDLFVPILLLLFTVSSIHWQTSKSHRHCALEYYVTQIYRYKLEIHRKDCSHSNMWSLFYAQRTVMVDCSHSNIWSLILCSKNCYGVTTEKRSSTLRCISVVGMINCKILASQTVKTGNQVIGLLTTDNLMFCRMPKFYIVTFLGD